MEQKKGFMEDGGGFDRICDWVPRALKRIRNTRFARAVGIALIVIVMANIVLGEVVQSLDGWLGHIDLNYRLQTELGITEGGNVSADELTEVNSVLFLVGYMGKYEDDMLSAYRDEPFSPQEKELLSQYGVLSQRLYHAYQDFSSGYWFRLGVFLLGLWLSGGRGRWRYVLLAILAGVGAAAAAVLACVAWINHDAASFVYTICGWVFEGNAWMLSPETSILAKVYPAEHTAGILVECFAMASKDALKGIREKVQSLLIVAAVAFVFKVIGHFKKKKEEETQ